jgi:hypothetical protein
VRSYTYRHALFRNFTAEARVPIGGYGDAIEGPITSRFG